MFEAELNPQPFESEVEDALLECRQFARAGALLIAEERLKCLLQKVAQGELRARILNDLGVISAACGRDEEAQELLTNALLLNRNWRAPAESLRRLSEQRVVPPGPLSGGRNRRVAIVSLLFNWPSTGGGTVHTAELVKFLQTTGYEVMHFYAHYPEWGIGTVTEPLSSPTIPLQFSPEQWTVSNIQERFRAALDQFQPDYVVITDSWNTKPVLARACENYKFILRIAAQECLCPLNNIRLLFDTNRFSTCPKHQFATPAACCACVSANGKFSGELHQLERQLVSYGTNEYDDELRWAFANAEAVLVVNPLIAAMVSPYARKVRVVPSGFDATRFESISSTEQRPQNRKVRVLFAGLVGELMKGFDVVLRAGQRLWSTRNDFELLATADPIGPLNEFTRFVGWQSQSSLPRLMSDSDIVVFPTIAEEALGRTAVEAMGCSRPVIASRIGGLQFTVIEGATGLLFEPGNVGDLAEKLVLLLDNPDLRESMGRAGRRRFDEHYRWETLLEKHYLPLFGEPIVRQSHEG